MAAPDLFALHYIHRRGSITCLKPPWPTITWRHSGHVQFWSFRLLKSRPDRASIASTGVAAMAAARNNDDRPIRGADGGHGYRLIRRGLLFTSIVAAAASCGTAANLPKVTPTTAHVVASTPGPTATVSGSTSVSSTSTHTATTVAVPTTTVIKATTTPSSVGSGRTTTTVRSGMVKGQFCSPVGALAKTSAGLPLTCRLTGGATPAQWS